MKAFLRMSLGQVMCGIPLKSRAGQSTPAMMFARNNNNKDFPGGPVVKAACSQYRGPGFNPWAGN